jgi:hypothetical protein
MLAQEQADASATVLTASFKSACGKQIKIGQPLIYQPYKGQMEMLA